MTEVIETERHQAYRQKLFFGICLAVTTMVSCFALYVRITRGFDLRGDEGILLQQIKNGVISVTGYGAVYSPLFRLVGESVPALRLLNVCILFAASGYFAIRAHAYFLVHSDSAHSALARCFLFIPLIGVALNIFLLTPSYNDLNLVGCFLLYGALLSFAGAEQLSPLREYRFLPYMRLSVIVALGQLCCWLAKPTTFATNCLIGLVFFCTLPRKTSIRAIIYSCIVFFALFNLVLFYFNTDIAQYSSTIISNFYESSLKYAQYLTKNGLSVDKMYYSVANILSVFDLFSKYTSIFIVSWGIVFILNSNIRHASKIRFLAYIIFVLYIMFYARQYFKESSYFAFSNPFRQYCFHIFMASAMAWIYKKRWQLDTEDIKNLIRALCLAAVPFSIGFGSTMSLAARSVESCVFWFAVALLLLPGILRPVLTGSALKIFVACTAVFVVGSQLYCLHKPYYWQESSLYAQTEHIAEGKLAGLSCSPRKAEYIRDLTRMAGENGLAPGTPLYVTGYGGPAIMFLLDARNTFIPWILGGQENCDHLARFDLLSMAEDTYDAMWIVSIENSGKGNEALDQYLPHRVNEEENTLAFTLFEPVRGLRQDFYKPNKKHYPERNRIRIRSYEAYLLLKKYDFATFQDYLEYISPVNR